MCMAQHSIQYMPNTLQMANGHVNIWFHIDDVAVESNLHSRSKEGKGREREREFNKLAIFPNQTPPTLPKLILVRSLYAAFTVSESLVDQSFL